jgi:hypothetical protein
VGNDIGIDRKFVGFDEFRKGAFGFEGFILLDIEKVMVLFVFLVEVLKIGLGSEGL